MALANLLDATGRHREAVDAFAEAAKRYRASGDASEASVADERARVAREKTSLGRASQFFKDILGRNRER